MGIKLENVKASEFTVNYSTTDGHIKTYVWKGVRGNRESVQEVPEEVYDYLRFETCTFQSGYLILSKEETNEEVIEEMAEITDSIKVYSVEEIKKLLNGKILNFKKEITKDTAKDVVLEFVRIAKEIKLDSDSMKTYLAELLGHKDNKEFIFPIED